MLSSKNRDLVIALTKRYETKIFSLLNKMDAEINKKNRKDQWHYILMTRMAVINISILAAKELKGRAARREFKQMLLEFINAGKLLVKFYRTYLRRSKTSQA